MMDANLQMEARNALQATPVRVYRQERRGGNVSALTEVDWATIVAWLTRQGYVVAVHREESDPRQLSLIPGGA